MTSVSQPLVVCARSTPDTTTHPTEVAHTPRDADRPYSGHSHTVSLSPTRPTGPTLRPHSPLTSTPSTSPQTQPRPQGHRPQGHWPQGHRPGHLRGHSIGHRRDMALPLGLPLSLPLGLSRSFSQPLLGSIVPQCPEQGGGPLDEEVVFEPKLMQHKRPPPLGQTPRRTYQQKFHQRYPESLQQQQLRLQQIHQSCQKQQQQQQQQPGQSQSQHGKHPPGFLLQYPLSDMHLLVKRPRQRRSLQHRSSLLGRGDVLGAVSASARMPDHSGFMEPIDSYFMQGHPGQSSTVDAQSGNDSNTEGDGDDEFAEEARDEVSQKKKKKRVGANCTSKEPLRRERRRSRSFCGPLSPLQTPTCSPRSHPLTATAADSTFGSAMARGRSLAFSPKGHSTTTPPLSARSAKVTRRRHNSCVAPNTREFRTLATIFGWVNVPGSNNWLKGSMRGRKDATDLTIGCHYNYNSDGHAPAGDSGDDSDLEVDFLRKNGSKGWSVVRESREYDATESCLQSPVQDPNFLHASIEYLTDLSDMDVPHDSKGVPGTRGSFLEKSPKRGKRRRPLRSHSGCFKLPSSADQDLDWTEEGHDQKEGPCPSPIVSLQSTRPSGIMIIQNGLADNQSVECSENIGSQRLRQLSSERLTQLQTRKFSLPPPQRRPTDSPSTECSDSTLLSPMSFGRGKDSGYMSFSTNSPSQQHSSAVTTAENSPTDTLRDDVATRPEVVIDVDFVKGKEIPLCGEKDQGISSKNPPPTPTPPAGPPRYHEVNMQMFNDPEDENSLAIVYSVLDSTDNDPASHASELRPIFACTVIKLIEKMTHQYGMDLGFRTDFFLTYRLFVSPVQLCKHLIRRYLWALEEDTSLREIVRVRTFVVIRHWIINHFEDDFLTSKSLRFIMASFLNDMRCNQRVLESPTDLLIIKNLVDLFKEMRRLYKGIAEQHLARFKEGEQNEEEQGGQTSQPASEVKTPSSNSDNKPVTGVNDEPRIIEQLTASSVKKIPIVLTGKTTNSDITGGVPHACGQIRSRNRASTLGGLITRPVAIEALHPTTPTKVSASKDSKHGGVSRQASENGTLIARERRLSASSIKSNKGNNVNWSTKMTLGIHKLRQKSEDIYQQILNPISALQKGEAKQCTCWTPEYTGISENPTLSAARSFPNLRPSVVVTNVNYESSPQPPAGNTTSGCPPSKTIKRLKSTLNLGPGSITTPVSPSPIPSPTRSQFTGMSSRHSRSNSNSSVGYHPNPECPYHVPSLGTVSSDSQRSLLNSNEYPEASSTLSTPKNIPQFNHPDSAVQTPSLSVTTGTPHSPAWYQCPWYTPSIPNSPSVLTTSYKPFILFYRSQVIAQQLCLLEQHFLDQVKWDEFLENELAKAGRRSWNKSQSSISGYLFKAEKKNGVEAISSRSDMVCMWVASEVVSTHPIEDRVRVIEKFIRIAQKCYQYRNFSSLSQLVMGLGSHFLCRLRRTWSRVGNYEMRVLRELQYVISPCKNWSALRTAMGVVGQQEATGDSSGQRYGAGVGLETPNGSGLFSPESMTSQNDTPSSKHPQSQTSVDKRGCIPFLGLFTFDLEHIMEQAAWYMPLTPSVLSEFENSQESSNGQCVIQRRAGSVTRPPPIAAHLTKPEPKDLPELIPTGKLLLNFYRCQLIAKTLKWFLAFQRRAHRYSFAMDATLYSKCLLLRVLNEDLLQELSDSCDSYRGD